MKLENLVKDNYRTMGKYVRNAVLSVGAAALVASCTNGYTPVPVTTTETVTKPSETATQTYTPEPPVINNIGDINYSYFLPISNEKIERTIWSTSYNNSLTAWGTSGQIPCEYEATLLIEGLETNYPITTKSEIGILINSDSLFEIDKSKESI